MNIETLVADVLKSAHNVGKQKANGIISADDSALYLKAHNDALFQVAEDFKMAIARMPPKIKNMKLMKG